MKRKKKRLQKKERNRTMSGILLAIMGHYDTLQAEALEKEGEAFPRAVVELAKIAGMTEGIVWTLRKYGVKVEYQFDEKTGRFTKLVYGDREYEIKEGRSEGSKGDMKHGELRGM